MKSKKIVPGHKHAARKLTLDRETIRRLDSHELEQVVGGMQPKSKTIPLCEVQVSELNDPACEG